MLIIFRRDPMLTGHVPNLPKQRPGILLRIHRILTVADKIRGQIDFPGIAGVQTVLRTEIQAPGAQHHHEHHGAENTDGGKPRSVPPHSVGHGGNGYKVVLLVVIPAVLLQQSAQHHRPGDEDQVGCHNHHAHGNKEPAQRGQWAPDGNRDVVGPAQKQHAADAKQIVCLGGLLPGALLFQQGHRAELSNLHQVFQIYQAEHASENQECILHSLPIDAERIPRPASQHPNQPQLRQLRKGDSSRKAACCGNQEYQQIFPQQHQAQISLAHAENIV